MKEILDWYDISPKTMALVPVNHIDYCTKIIETDQTYYINVPSLTLIKKACLRGYSTYEGRREAVKYFTGFEQKVPIPIIPWLNIYTFPTISPQQYDCCWLFPNHIQSIEPAPKNKLHSIITFKNGQTLQIHQSANTLRKQMQRSAVTMLLYREKELIHS